MKKYFILFVAAASIAVACNKTKTYSNRLDGGVWKVTELSVDGVNQSELPDWNINECDIYGESCTGEWQNAEGGHGEFVWQFRDKGKTFEISNQSDHTHSHADEEAQAQCSDFSGVYTVEESGKKKMKFSSTVTIGYPGSTAVITIEK
jgi:hypothetical protein